MASGEYFSIGPFEGEFAQAYHATLHRDIFQRSHLKLIDDSMGGKKPAYQARLGDIIDRLELFGSSLSKVKARYDDPFWGWSEPHDVSFEELLALIQVTDVPTASTYIYESTEGGVLPPDVQKRLPRPDHHSMVMTNTWDLSTLFERMGTLDICRVLATRPENHDLLLTWDFTDVVKAGYFDADEFTVGLDKRSRILLITEGESDRRVLKHALEILRPGIEDVFTFVDGSYPFNSASKLVDFVNGLNAIGLKNRALAIFDNDSAGLGEMRKVTDALLPNLRVAKLPDLDVFRAFPTISLGGEMAIDDINGRAGSIEAYLDLGAEDRVRWKGPAVRGGPNQGGFDRKAAIVDRFLNTEADHDYDFAKIQAVLDMIVRECVDLDHP